MYDPRILLICNTGVSNDHFNNKLVNGIDIDTLKEDLPKDLYERLSKYNDGKVRVWGFHDTDRDDNKKSKNYYKWKTLCQNDFIVFYNSTTTRKLTRSLRLIEKIDDSNLANKIWGSDFNLIFFLKDISEEMNEDWDGGRQGSILYNLDKKDRPMLLDLIKKYRNDNYIDEDYEKPATGYDPLSNPFPFYKFLIEEKGLYFKLNIVEDFLLSLKAKQFLILSGSSGTGKTKLAMAYGEYLDKKIAKEGCKHYRIIPVGSNWTENRHIVGYFNPLSEKYMSTETYDFIKKYVINKTKCISNCQIDVDSYKNYVHSNMSQFYSNIPFIK